MKTCTFYLIIGLLLNSCNLLKPELGYFEGSFDEVLQYNIESGKPLLVHITNDECRMCDIMKEQLGTNPKALAYLNQNFINYSYNSSLNGDMYLNRLLNEYAFPTWVLINEEGKIQSVITGVKALDQFTNYVRCIKGLEKGDFTLFAGELSNVTSDLYSLLNYTHQAWLSSNIGEFEKAKLYAEKAINIEPYFFNFYLASQACSKIGNKNEAMFFAKKALEFKSGKNRFLNNDLITRLDHFLDNNNELAETYTLDLPVLSLHKTEHDFGSLKRNEKARYKFTYKNTGNSPLVVSDVRSSCSCTIPDWTKTPIPPGNEGELLIDYDTSKPGRFNKVLLLFSNGKIGTYKVVIKGNVLK